MKGCRAHRETMSSVLDGAVSPAERAALETHLAQCPECRKAFEELRWTTRQVEGLEPVEPPPWMTAKIMARLREERAGAPSFWRGTLFPILAGAQFRVASLVLVGAAGYYLVSRSGGVPRNLPEARPAAVAEESAPAPEPKGAPYAPAPPDSSVRKEKKAAAPPPPRPAPPPAFAPAPALAERKDRIPAAGDGPETAAKKAAGPVIVSPDRAAPAEPAAAEAPAPAVAGGSLAGAVESPRSSRVEQASAGTEEGTLRSHETAKREMTAGKEAAAPSAPSAAPGSKASPGVAIRIDPFDPSRFGSVLEHELSRAGAEVVTPSRKTDGRVVVVRLQSRRLPELLQRLSQAGSVRERPENLESLPGVILVTVRW